MPILVGSLPISALHAGAPLTPPGAHAYSRAMPSRRRVSWWSRCAAAERLQRIENAAETIRAASAAGSEVGGLPDAAERHACMTIHPHALIEKRQGTKSREARDYGATSSTRV